MPPEEQPYLITESIPHLVWVAGPDGATQYINRRWQQYTGLSPGEAMGWDWQSAIHPDDVPQALELWRRALRTGETYAAEFRLRGADGVYRWHIDRALPLRDGRGNITHWFGTCTDIEDQKRAEDALRASEGRFRALIEKSFDAILLLTAEGTVAYASPSTARLLGFSPEELLGRDSFDLVHPDDRAATAALFAQLAHLPGGTLSNSHRARCKDGGWRWLDVRGTNLLGDPSVRCVVLNYQDVTERKRLEEQYRQAQKMEAVGQLAGGIAHDFNNLLTVINGQAALLLQDVAAGTPAADAARAILKAGQRAAGLTQQLLAFSRKQIVAPRVLDLNAVVADTEAMLRPLIGEDVFLTRDLQPGLGAVRADPTQVQQVVMNLAVNARDAMPQGGRLSLLTRDAGAFVLLAVTDTGCGMTAEVKAHLFEPFFTTKGPGEGTGLGLPTVYGIVKQSGGHIEVESQPGEGTAVRVYLPRADGAPAEERPNGEGPLPRGSETVLLAEDEDGVRALVRQVLQAGGYAVLEARDGAEALGLAEQHRGRVDLLVTDVVMPGLDGRALAERLVGHYPGLKVLYLSGYTDDAVVRHGVRQEKVHFLQKPFSPADLARKVREVLDLVPCGERGASAP
jgi:PAS domain S-box-containing protein